MNWTKLMARAASFLIAAAWAGVWTGPVGAQFQRATPPETMQIEEQPGYEPSQEEERAPAAYLRQLVFFSFCQVTSMLRFGQSKTEN
jgi:hypothetical protein